MIRRRHHVIGLVTQPARTCIVRSHVHRYFRALIAVLAPALSVTVGGCEERTADRSAASAASVPSSPVGSASGEKARAPRSPQAAETPAATDHCIVPFGAPAPAARPSPSCPADPTGPLNLAKGWISFTGGGSVPRVAVEIADNPTSRERGLMYRTSMPEDQGMIFDWIEESERAFWMHNTCIPLDMLFIARDGTILGIVEQVPPMNDTPRGVPCPAAHVLELNAGWAREHGLKPGMRIVRET
jgi:uncharacterized membrane protein (UPF0127 family)